MARKTEDGSYLPNKCLPFFHDYRVEEENSYGYRTKVCQRCRHKKTQKHFGRNVWL